MPYSVVAAVMILATVLLSACGQESQATLEDKSGNFYGRSAIASAQQNHAVFIPSYESHYVPPASVDAIEARPIAGSAPAPAKPLLATKGQPQSASNPITQTALAYQWPVNGAVTSSFGRQREGIANEGITIVAPKGSPIHAAAAGQVAFVGNNVRDYGNMVILRHANGDMTSYAHADRIVVAKGMSVKQGDTIGYVGTSGRAKEPQLHFAMRSGDHVIDPTTRLPSQLASR